MIPLDRVGLVVVNYGASALLADSVMPAVGITVIVDNFSTNVERDFVAALCATRGWRFVANETNRGFGAGVNVGVHAAIEVGAEALLVLNPDASIATESVVELVTELDASPGALIAPTVLTEQGTVWFARGVLDRRRGVARHAPPAADALPDWVTGACMCFTAAAWRRGSGFDERYFLYWEDVDFSASWRAAGGELRVSSRATAIHAVGGTQVAGTLRKSATYVRYNVRGRRLFARTHCTPSERLRWWLVTPTYLRRLARITGLRQRPLSWREFWLPVLQGLLQPLPRV